MTLAVQNDAEDVNDFLKRIQELGHRRDQEDEERNRKLEEEILQGRRERQARRAERARSISPTKDSPYRLSPSPSLNTSRSSYGNMGMNINIDEEASQRARSPPSRVSTPDRSASIDAEKPMATKNNAHMAGYKATQSKAHEQMEEQPEPEKAEISRLSPSPSSAMPSRSATMSWQRRPPSQIAERPRNRPLSMIAVENAARSPRGTPEPTTDDEEPTVSRQQIANSLATKDPAWFRQTPDRGRNSPAFRRNQVEDSNVVDVGTSRMKMPGMMQESKQARESAEVSTSPTKRDFMETDVTDSPPTGMETSNSYKSPIPQSSSQRFDPISQGKNHEGDDIDFRHSPSLARVQSRTSPGRPERPVSPTKGMGGFVQSAMMKRSESVAKRHLVTSPMGLSRGNSVASNRSGYDGSLGLMSPPPGLSRPSSSNRETSPTPLSRPASNHGNTTVTQADRPTTSDSMKSPASTPNNSYNNTPKKPSLSSGRSDDPFGADTNVSSPIRQGSIKTSPSTSVKPSGRSSPTKSWLDSMLSKPETPSMKVAHTPPQPAWRSDIIKAKQGNKLESGDWVRNGSKHEVVSVGGLMRSPQLSGLEKTSTFNVLHSRLAADSLPRNAKNDLTYDVDDDTNKKSHSKDTFDIDKDRMEATPPKAKPQNSVDEVGVQAPSSSNHGASRSGQPTSLSTDNSKPDVPPKKDFRSSLKQSQPLPDVAPKTEPEFKNVFGTLRRTKTQNYVAPDQFRDLKSNISKSKAELNITGGPKKSEPRDEFKDAILKKKEDFKKMQVEGTGVPKSSTLNKPPAPLPEALARKATLGKQNAPKSTSASVASPESVNIVAHKREARDVPMARLQHETSAPSRMETTSAPVSGLAARFNPGLASILARGPLSSSPEISRTSSPVTARSTRDVSDSAAESDANASATQLTHMTKARARGPKRKAPSSMNKSAIPPDSEDEPVVKSESSTTKGFEKADIAGRSRGLEAVSKTHVSSSNQSQTSSKIGKGTEDEDSHSNRPSAVGPHSKTFPLMDNKQSAFGDSENVGRDGSGLATLSAGRSKTFTPAQFSDDSAVPSVSDQDRPGRLSVTVASQGDVTDSGVSVKDAVARMLSPTAASGPTSDTLRKKPIKLPTHEDEAAEETPASSQETGIPKHDKADTAQKKIPAPLSLIKPSRTEARSSPKQARMEGPPLTGPKLTTPRKVTTPTEARPSVTSPAIENFFQNRESVPKFNIDTQRILSTRAGEVGRIKSLRSQLYQVNSGGKKSPVPAHQEQLLFEGNMYLCTHTFGTALGKKVTEVYLWIGSRVPRASIQEAEAFAQREAKSAAGESVILEQGKETSQFIEALGGIAIIRRGTSSKYDSLAPHILCGRRHVGQIVFDEVDFATTSLCSGFPYLVFTQSGKLYLWKGKGSDVEELSCARLIGMDFGATGEIEDVEEGAESVAFLSLFGPDSKILKCADHWRLKPKYHQYSTRLFRANAAASSKISEIFPFTQSDLLATHVHILDAFFEIYILVGPQAQSQYASFCAALLFAQEYAILAADAEDRPSVPYSAVVLEGAPRDMKFCFRKWDTEARDGEPSGVGKGDARQATSRGKSLRVVSLSAALEATRF